MTTHDREDTARRQVAETALRESEYRYRNLFQAMAASFWELDFSGVGALLRELKAAGVRDYPAHFRSHPEFVRRMMRATRVIDVNDQAVAVFGCGDKAAMLESVEPFWPESSNAVYADSVIAAITGRASYSAECKVRAVDGRELDALFTACFPANSVLNGKLLIGVIDISERVRAQDMLQRLQAEFAHAARVSMLGELTASIAHEVNQPLAAIATNASAGARWLDRPEPDLVETRILIDAIVADASRAAGIVGRVRDMAAHRAPERTAVSINGAIEEAFLFLRQELRAHDVALTLHLGHDLPLVMADRMQLQQVVVNLAVNAMQAMTHQEVGARSLSVTSAQAGGGVSVTVQDSGPGIATENLDRLFQSFFSAKETGMGMGLAICRSIVELHGGSITVANGDAGGACFTFTIDARPSHP